MFDGIWMPIVIVGGLAILFGFALSFAAKKFEVAVDERVSNIREVLPGANCAACGQTGCDAFAQSVVDGNSMANGCPVGGSDVALKIAEIMGLDPTELDAKVARVLCGGTKSSCREKYNYEGIEDCTAAANLFGGPSACSFGCLGKGNCFNACPFDAIVIEDGLARVLKDKCTGCGKCVTACPKKIIELVPFDAEYTVACSSLDKGNIVRQNCDVGCIGCGRCVKVCSVNAIDINNFLAKINPALCVNCGECAKVCPTKSIGVYYNCVNDTTVSV